MVEKKKKSKKKKGIKKGTKKEKIEDKEKSLKEIKEVEEDNINKEKGLGEKKLKKKQNKQVMWASILMISIILVLILVPIIKKNFFDKFEYINLNFYKTQSGETIFYSTRVPLADKQGNIAGTFSINFRNDPRELESIEVDTPNKVIAFNKEELIYITLDSGMRPCEDNIIAMSNLAGFLNGFALLEVKSAVNNKESANLNELPYVTCENSPNNTVILVNEGEETKIKKIKGMCYELSYKDCEINQVAEKFILVILERYMGYFTRK